MSKSLEALERMKADLIKIQCELFDDVCNDERVLAVYQLEDYQTIKQDLELLEQLKQQRDSLAINNGELCVKVCKLEKALDKACERLDYDCPVGINLIDDLDCENCCDDTKECWKKYLLNLADAEVLE